MSDVKIVRMTSGEQLLSKVTEKMEGGYTLKNPALMIPHGQGQLGLAPWMPYADTSSFDVPASEVSFVVDPVTDLLNEYSQAFGSGLVVPDKKVATPTLKLSD